MSKLCQFFISNLIRFKALGDERSNKSHDDLSRLGEDMDEIGSLSLGESSVCLLFKRILAN